MERMNTQSFPLLSAIGSPADLRKLNEDQLPQVADELRRFLIESVATSGALFGDVNVPVNFTAVPQGNVVQGGTVTIDIAATSEVNGLPVSVVATVEAGSTSSYGATSGGAGSLDIPIPEQTVMGTDLIIDAGTGSGDFDVDADATELVIQLTSAVIDLQVTMPASISLTLDASESGDCSVLGDGVTIPVPAPTN